MQAAMAKLFCTDIAMRVTTDAVQVLGGYGYVEDYPVERYMREAKALQIVEGTNQVQRLVISRQLRKRITRIGAIEIRSVAARGRPIGWFGWRLWSVSGRVARVAPVSQVPSARVRRVLGLPASEVTGSCS